MERIFNKPEVIFSIFSLVFGIMLIFITPPNQAPDETFHFERAYSVCVGPFNTSIIETDLYAYSLYYFVQSFKQKQSAA